MTVAVVGGGIVGLATAWALNQRNLDVLVLDAGRVGGCGASVVNAGWAPPTITLPLPSPGIVVEGARHAVSRDGAFILRPSLGLTHLRWLASFVRSAREAPYRRGVAALLALNAHTFGLFEAMLDELAAAGLPVSMPADGLLALARHPDGLAWFDRLFDELRSLGFTDVFPDAKIEHMGGDEARRRDPIIGEAVERAAWCSVDRHVDPEALIAAMSTRLRQCGVRFAEDTAVTGLARDARSWTVTTPAGAHRASRVVVAAGVGSVAVLRHVGVKLPVIGGKGYSVDLVDPAQLPRQPLYLCEPKVGMTPFADRVRLSGTFQLPGRDNDVGVGRVSAMATASLPYLREGWAGEQGWTVWPPGRAGLRPCTPDGLPIIGEVPGQDGLYVATGHAMLGLTLAPVTGSIIADMVAAGVVPDYARPFAVGRG